MGRLARLTGALLLSATLCPAAAAAQNDHAILVGSNAALTGGAVVATVFDGSALYHNPAGLVAPEGSRVDLQGSLLGFRVSQEPEFYSTPAGQTQQGDHFEILSVPTAASFVYGNDGGVAIGIGLFNPRLSDEVTRARFEAAGTASTATRVYQLQRRESTIRPGLGVAWRAGQRFRLGVGLAVPIDTSLYSDSLSAHDLLPDDSALVANSNNLVSDVFVGVQLDVGLQWEFADRWVLGLSARTPRLDFLNIHRNSSVNIAADTGSAPQFESYDDTPASWIWGAESSEPASLRLGTAYHWADGWVTGEIEVAHPLETERTTREFAFNARVGFYAKASETVRVGAGIFTDLDATRGELDFGQREHDFYGLSGGLELLTPIDIGGYELNLGASFALRYAVGIGEVGSMQVDPEQPGTVGTQMRTESIMHDIGIYFGTGVTL